MGTMRKPLFMDQTEGFHVEFSPTDDMTIGGLTITPPGSGGTGIDVGGNKVYDMAAGTTDGDAIAWGQNNVELGSTSFTSDVDMEHNYIHNLATPVAEDDAVNKAYVDALATGLDPHASCIVKVKSGLGSAALRAGVGGSPAALPMNNETFNLKLHNPAGTTVPVVFTTEASLTAVAATINTAVQAAYGTGYGAVAVVNGANIDLKDVWTGSKSRVDVSGVTEGTPGDLAAKTGITAGTSNGVGWTAAGSGVGKTLTAPTNAASWNTIDGYTFAATGSLQRVLVASEGGDEVTPAIDNGIYTVTTLGNGTSASTVLTRATDCDQTSSTDFHQGVYTFITSGTTFHDQGYSCVTVDPITVDTTPNAWSQFSGAPSYTYDQGLIKILSSIKVDLDTSADAAGTGAAGGSSGLEFDVDTAAGKLRAKVDPAKGIQRYANGIGIHLDGTTLQLDHGGAGTGISVKGVPNLFEIGGNATSQTGGVGQVTAANLNTLTAGASSNADALHTHSSLISTSTPLVKVPMNCTGTSVVAGDPVYITGTPNVVGPADAKDDSKAKVIGVCMAAPVANVAQICVSGVAPNIAAVAGSGPGVALYLDSMHGLKSSIPSSVGGPPRVIQCGVCMNSNDLFVRIVDYGKKAA